MSEKAAPDSIRFATDPWPPFFLESESSFVTEGIGVDLVQAVFEQVEGLAPSFPQVPWKRALIEVAQGKKDAIALLLETPERQKTMLFTQPLIQVPSYIYYNKDRFPQGFEWVTAEDLSPYSMVVVKGYSYGEFLDNLIAEGLIQTYEAINSEQALQMLAKGRVDLFPENATVAKALIEKLMLDQVVKVSRRILNRDVLRIGVSKASPFAARLSDIDKAITNLTSSGEISRLVKGSGANSFESEE